MYDQYYELTGRPFQLTPDPRFYFESATHRKALSYLGYGLAQGEGFIVITGEIGAGKTTLVRHLMETVDPGRLTAATIVTTQLEGKDLLHMVAESFGVAAAGSAKSDRLQAIEQFLHAEAREGRRCLLVIDEAQNLPLETLEELRMLSNFQLGNQALLQIFLLGQPEFRDQLRGDAGLEQLRQRVIATHHLEPMLPTEMEPYIAHRLSKVGWTGRPDFTDGAIDRLYLESGGVPRKLNMLMTRVLLMGAVEKADEIDRSLIEDVLADMSGDTRIDEGQTLASSMTPGWNDGLNPDTEVDGEEPIVVTAEPQADVMPAPTDEPKAMDNATPELQASTPRASAARFFRPGVKPPLFDTGLKDSAKVSHDEISPATSAADSVNADDGESNDEIAPAPRSIDEEQAGALTDRMDMLENQVKDQEATIRRLVAMLLDYVEREDGLAHRRAA